MSCTLKKDPNHGVPPKEKKATPTPLYPKASIPIKQKVVKKPVQVIKGPVPVITKQIQFVKSPAIMSPVQKSTP